MARQGAAGGIAGHGWAVDVAAHRATLAWMAPPKASRMFRVIVLAGVSLAACGGKEDSGDPELPSNPPGPRRDAAVVPDDAAAVVPDDAGLDAPADARDEQMPAIK